MNTTTFALTATKRGNEKKSAREARQAGLVPGVLYGHGVDPVSISIPYSDLLRTYRKTGESALIELTVDKKPLKVLIHRLTLHPVKQTIDHVDFYVVNLKEKTSVSIPFEFVGESSAVKNDEGLLMKECENILIRCLPTEIPSHIDVSLEKLENINDQITVADLNLDTEKYEIMDLTPETVVAMVIAPTLATEEETEAEGEESEEGAGEEGSEEKTEE